jgi:hypothetical protein
MPARREFVLITPRFHASSHVIALLLAIKSSRPELVLKAPRLPWRCDPLVLEASHLRGVQAGRRPPLASVPQVFSLSQHGELPVMCQTALVGRPVDRRAVMRRLSTTNAAVQEWLAQIQPSRPTWSTDDPTWFDRLVRMPLDELDLLRSDADDRRCLTATLALAERLRGLRFPLVREHGDLSPPNLLLLRSGGVGAVDWELSEPRGLPGHDLFFFLTYAAFARARASRCGGYVEAYRSAFCGPDAWAMPCLRPYVQRMGLAREHLATLLALCWTRYIASLARRSSEGLCDASPQATAAWLRTNRYYGLWRHTIEHLDDFDWSAAVPTPTKS